MLPPGFMASILPNNLKRSPPKILLSSIIGVFPTVSSMLDFDWSGLAAVRALLFCGRNASVFVATALSIKYLSTKINSPGVEMAEQ